MTNTHLPPTRLLSLSVGFPSDVWSQCGGLPSIWAIHTYYLSSMMQPAGHTHCITLIALVACLTLSMCVCVCADRDASEVGSSSSRPSAAAAEAPSAGGALKSSWISSAVRTGDSRRQSLEAAPRPPSSLLGGGCHRGWGGGVCCFTP